MTLDPRYDPAFQRGFRGDDRERVADPLSAARDAGDRAADPAPELEPRASGEGKAPAPVDPDDAVASSAGSHPSRRWRALVLLLGVASAVVAVAGAVGVLALSTRAPIGLSLTTSTDAAAWALAAQILAGPALATGTIGVVAALGLAASPLGRPAESDG